MRKANIRFSFFLLSFMFIALVAEQIGAAPYIITPQGKKIMGKSLKADESGQLILTTGEGQMTFPKGTKFFVDEPPVYAKAKKMIQAMQYDEAIRALKGIVKDYYGLGWDHRARLLLPAAYFGKKDYQNTIAACEAVFKSSPQARKDDEIVIPYLESLAQTGNADKLHAALNELVPVVGRKAAARAQMMRGNIFFNSANYEKALLDFMRTADFFRDVTETAPEALFRTAECLEKIGDARAEEYYRRLKKDYPTTAWAAKVPRK